MTLLFSMLQTHKLTALILFIVVFNCNIANATKYASIIIDDLGNNLEYGKAIIELPYNLTFAILPRTTYAKPLARLATKNRREVMLHLPMQSVEHFHTSPGTLDLHMTKTEFKRQLQQNLNAVPYIRGVNNHMGSLLTRHPGHMAWLMDELQQRGNLYFVDSKTTSKSIADKIAVEHDIPNLSRDFFIDPDYSQTTMKKQFERFLSKIDQRGYALAIAHPHPATIAFLNDNLGRLKALGITLVPVSKLISTTQQTNNAKESQHVACTGTPCTGL